jgi:hypothetical protein
MLSYGVYSSIFLCTTFGSLSLYMFIFIFVIPLWDYVIYLKALFDMLVKATDNDRSATCTVSMYDNQINITKLKKIRIYVAYIVSVILTMNTFVFFVGCIVTIQYYYSGDSCPDRVKDCFAFSNSMTDFLPVDRFVCNPGEIVRTSNSTSYHFVVCYGYILYEQTTSNILYQLGICVVILFIITILFIFLYRISRQKCAFIITIILSLEIFVMIILLNVLKVTLGYLTYNIVGTTMMVCFAAVISRFLTIEKIKSCNDYTQV